MLCVKGHAMIRSLIEFASLYILLQEVKNNLDFEGIEIRKSRASSLRPGLILAYGQLDEVNAVVVRNVRT